MTDGEVAAEQERLAIEAGIGHPVAACAPVRLREPSAARVPLLNIQLLVTVVQWLRRPRRHRLPRVTYLAVSGDELLACHLDTARPELLDVRRRWPLASVLVHRDDAGPEVVLLAGGEAIPVTLLRPGPATDALLATLAADR